MTSGDIGRPRVTSADVAALAGVSQSTVSYVMTGKRTISESTRQRVLEAMKTLGFQPNAGARALAGRRSNVIGLVVRLDATTDMEGTLPFIETITRRARERDYDVVLVAGDDGTAEMERLVGRSVVDAVILMDIRENDPRLATAAGLAAPVVLIGSPIETHGLDAVDFDFVRAGELAVDELVRDGATRVVLIGEPPVVSAAGFTFVRGFEGAVVRTAEAAGVEVEVIRPAEAGVAGFHTVAGRLLHGAGRTGIVARTPQVVGWVLHYLSEQSLRPGRDCALVGMCTDEAAVAFPAAVTNVSPEPRAVSDAAVARLFERLEARADDQERVLVPPRLTRRDTTR